MLKNILNLEGVVALNKEQQKNVFGGKSAGCAVMMQNGDGEVLVVKGLSLSEVTEAGGNGGGNRWCCASCSTATWINSCNIC